VVAAYVDYTASSGFADTAGWYGNSAVYLPAFLSLLLGIRLLAGSSFFQVFYFR